VTELEAERRLEEREKRNSNILNEMKQQEVDELSNQKWLEKKVSGPNNSLSRSGSLGSNRSLRSAQSSDDTGIKKPVAPAKPPRSTRTS